MLQCNNFQLQIFYWSEQLILIMQEEMVNHLPTFHGQLGWESPKGQLEAWPISMNAVQENLFMVTSNLPIYSSTMTSTPISLILALAALSTLLAIIPPPVALWAEPFPT